MYTVKNCEVSAVLSDLQSNKLACHSFMNVGRKHETPGSETKALITHSTARSVNTQACVLVSLAPIICGGNMDASR